MFQVLKQLLSFFCFKSLNLFLTLFLNLTYNQLSSNAEVSTKRNKLKTFTQIKRKRIRRSCDVTLFIILFEN